ncbi:MAG: hypothetical protein AAF899_08610 [Pseudomonadota bacterium]
MDVFSTPYVARPLAALRWGIMTATLAVASPAAATILGGEASLNGAPPVAENFALLSPPFDVSVPASTVGADNLQVDRLFAFDENQNVQAETEIVVEIGGVIPAGTVVASHYVVFDPRWGASVAGHIDFDAPILGVATSAWSLGETDRYQNVGVSYRGVWLRGLEPTDDVRIDPADPFRLLLRLDASSPGDSIRVFTSFSPSVRRGPRHFATLPWRRPGRSSQRPLPAVMVAQPPM